MGFKVNTNMDALNAYYALSRVNQQTVKSQLRLATGKQINHVWDDTSGFTIGNQLKTKASILRSVQGNIGSGKDMLATAEGALLNVKDLVTQIRTKISDSTNPTSDREALAKDIAALGEEIFSIFKTTKFNETALLVGTMASGGGTAKFEFQVSDSTADKLRLDFASSLASTATSAVVAAGGSENVFISTDLANILSSIMNTAGTANSGTGRASDTEYAVAIGSLASATAAGYDSSTKSAVEKLADEVDSALSKIGNLAQRLTIKSDFFDVAIANAESSVSRLFDTDYALEQLNATKGNIMQQAALSMMAQLSFAPQNVLSLFQ